MSNNVNWNSLKAAATGNTVTAPQFNALVDLVRSLVVCDSPDYRITRNLGGTRLSINFPSQTVSAATTTTTTSFPWNVHNTTSGSTAQVQLNGGDGYVAQLNGFVCNVNGTANDSETGSPLAYPQLSITGNGWIYAYAVPATFGTNSPLASVDLYFNATLPSQDETNYPSQFYVMPVASVSSYTATGSTVTFNLNKSYGPGYGPSYMYYCNNGELAVY